MWWAHSGNHPPTPFASTHPHAPIKASCDRIPARTFSNIFDFRSLFLLLLGRAARISPPCCFCILCFIYECFGVIFLRFSSSFFCCCCFLLNMHEIIQIKGAQPGSALISLRWATKYGSLPWGARFWRSWSVVDFCCFFFKACWFECSLERFVENPLGKN